MGVNIVLFTPYIDWHTLVTSYFFNYMLHQEAAVAQEVEQLVMHIEVSKLPFFFLHGSLEFKCVCE